MVDPLGLQALRAVLRIAHAALPVGLRGDPESFLLTNPMDPLRRARMASPRSGGMSFLGLGLVSRSSSTPHLESQLRSMDNYPDTGGLS